MKKVRTVERNWALVVIASIMILLNLILLVAAVLYWATFGWWSLIAGIGAATSIYLSVEAIRTNDPTWLLLDLILPT